MIVLSKVIREKGEVPGTEILHWFEKVYIIYLEYCN